MVSRFFPKIAALHSRGMTARPAFIACLILLVFAFFWVGQTQAARWEEHRAIALRAVDEIDYAKAIEQFEAAIYFAQALPAADRDIAGLWEDLSAAYLADEQYRRAWEAISDWDKVLVANAGEAWVRDQQVLRDEMTRLLYEQIRKSRDETAEAAP